MERIKLKAILIGDGKKLIEVKTNGYHNKETKIISFVEPDELKTMVEYNYEKNRLRRDNEEIYLEYDFILKKKTKGILTSKELNKEIIMEIYTKKMSITNKHILLEYTLENSQYKLEIKMEEHV